MSMEDYDEFGNYIGADIDSDDDGSEIAQAQPQVTSSAAPLDGYVEEQVDVDMDAEATGGDMHMQLATMDGVGTSKLSCSPTTTAFKPQQ